jgi:hypothetical protein
VTHAQFRLHVEELSTRSSDFKRVVELHSARASDVREAESDELRLRSWRPLAEWLDDLGGYDGELPGPDGKRYAVSLEAWRHANPQDTYVKVFYTRRESTSLNERLAERPEPYADGS